MFKNILAIDLCFKFTVYIHWLLSMCTRQINNINKYIDYRVIKLLLCTWSMFYRVIKLLLCTWSMFCRVIKLLLCTWSMFCRVIKLLLCTWSMFCRVIKLLLCIWSMFCSSSLHKNCFPCFKEKYNYNQHFSMESYSCVLLFVGNSIYIETFKKMCW